MKIIEHSLKKRKIIEQSWTNHWWSWEILENLRNHWNIIENHWTTMGKSSEIIANYWKSLNIIENHWKIMENNHAPTFFNPLSSHVWFGFASVPPKWVKYMCIRRRVFYVFGMCFWCVFGWQNRLLKFDTSLSIWPGRPWTLYCWKKLFCLFLINQGSHIYIYIYIYIYPYTCLFFPEI